MGEKKTANTIKETLKETNRLKSNCSANNSIYTLLMRLYLLLLLRNGYIAIALNLYPETTPKRVIQIYDIRNH